MCSTSSAGRQHDARHPDDCSEARHGRPRPERRVHSIKAQGGELTLLDFAQPPFKPDQMSGLISPTTSEEVFANIVTTLWLIVTFGESQMMAQLLARRWLVAPLIHTDFRAYHLPLAQGHCASVTLNHQK